MDYRKFLGQVEEKALPYTGGPSVHAADRRLRLKGTASVGWWRFRLEGRFATPLAPTEPEGLELLPRVLGHWFDGWLFGPSGRVELVDLLPDEEPPRLAPMSARRWHSGELLFEGLEFEGEAEDEARRALEEGRTLKDVSGAAATLRSAFAYAVVRGAAARLGIPAQPGELRRDLAAIADGGEPGAAEVLRRLAAERTVFIQRAEQVRAYAEAQQQRAGSQGQVARAAASRRALDPEERAVQALEVAGATVASVRRVGGGNLEVVYRFLGSRFVTVVEARTLQVIDAGLCLAGSDSEVTLESLPSVIREAIEDGHIVITRHV